MGRLYNKNWLLWLTTTCSLWTWTTCFVVVVVVPPLSCVSTTTSWLSLLTNSNHREQQRQEQKIRFGHSMISTAAAVSSSATVLFAQQQQQQPTSPKRQPRRNLQKRRKRFDNSNDSSVGTDNSDMIAWGQGDTDIRPIVASRSKEMGEDYWIDPIEMEFQKQLQQQQQKPTVGQVPSDKLWTEVLAPYKQNWIGICSMIVVMLATIVIKFPELLNPPTVPIPDL